METVTVTAEESGIDIFVDYDMRDKWEEREAELRKKAERLNAKAERLRKNAQALIEKARVAEKSAREALAMAMRPDGSGMDEEEPDEPCDPEPLTLLWDVDEKGRVKDIHAFDVVELWQCGVRDFGDHEILRQYIGSTAEVMKE